MAKLRPIQKTFKSGEISPKLRSRPDTGEYIQGVKFMENFLTTPYGSAVRRTGTELVDLVSDTRIFGRIFTFRVEGSESFIIGVTEDEITVYDRAGRIPTEVPEDPGGDSSLTNPGFNIGGDGWNVNLVKSGSDSLNQEPRVTFISGLANLQSGNAADIEIELVGNPLEPEPQETVVIRPCSAELTQLVELDTGLGSDNFSLNIAIADNSFRAQGVLLDYLSIGTTEGASDIPFTTDPGNSSTALFSPGVDNFWISYKLDWNDSLDVSVAGPLPTPPLPPPSSPGNIGSSASVGIDAFALVNLTQPAVLDVTFASPYTEQQVRELQVEKAPGLNTMYFVVRADFTHKKLIFDRATNTWTFVDVNYTNPPPTWGADGYPGTITFFQGRLWVAGSLEKPVTVWGSAAGEDNYEDFSAVGAEDDDSLELPLARDGIIQWIQGGKALVVGTDTAEHIIFGNAQFDLLTPAAARATQHSAYGSARIHTEWLSEKITFISQDARRLYLGDYDRESFGFLSDEISYLAEHITAPGIVEVAYTQNPRAHVWAVKLDGEIVGCTYQRETDAVGWHRQVTPLGRFISITVTEEFGRSVVWVLTERQNRLYLERVSRNVFLDFHVIRQYEAATDVVDGLDNLEGLLVHVVGDGAFAGAHVVEGGEVTVTTPANTFSVGLPYVSTMITLPVEVLHQSDNLTAKLVRWNRIYVRLLNSVIPTINGILPPDRTPGTPMDTREQNSTQDVSVATAGFDRDAEITIVQDLPFGCEVVGLYGELTEDGLD